MWGCGAGENSYYSWSLPRVGPNWKEQILLLVVERAHITDKNSFYSWSLHSVHSIQPNRKRNYSDLHCTQCIQYSPIKALHANMKRTDTTLRHCQEYGWRSWWEQFLLLVIAKSGSNLMRTGTTFGRCCERLWSQIQWVPKIASNARWKALQPKPYGQTSVGSLKHRAKLMWTARHKFSESDTTFVIAESAQCQIRRVPKIT